MSSPFAKPLWVALFLSGGLLAGCPPQTFVPPLERQAVPKGTTSVYSLAGRLGMRVDQSSRSLACLASPFNRILVLGNPDSRVYVNGRPVGAPGQVLAIGDVLFVPDSLEPQIRAVLRNGERGGGERREPNQVIVREPNRVIPSKPVHGLVVLDAGHGGKDPGTTRNFNGRPGREVEEKRLNLAVVQMVAENLKARGASVVLTRSDDTFIELDERAEIANRRQADLFLSIHTNSMEAKPWICGFSVYVAESPSAGSVAAAEDIAKRLEQAGIEPCGNQPHRAPFRVLVLNRRPAALLEIGFITNSDDRAKLVQTAYQRKLADAVADGVAGFLRNR